ncbi:sulfotransferase domain-containing protein [Marixanthomonas ophiurae]|uniref:Sulfotransferase domain-containing protein n=1 Tax=Marixanthomonas ophiurae TaxID=387659 RepID=A0A3E1QDC0_9FLAO|nr:sulfotransferase domain-containing protein [Marixanthomonas ophiurae]RFN60056.1 hypothetical protein DZ858_08410 [Marixanthomonas ophiurae]
MKNRIKSFIKYTIQQYHSLKPVKSETKAVDDTKLFFLTGYDKSGTTWIKNTINDINNFSCIGSNQYFDFLNTGTPESNILKTIKENKARESMLNISSSFYKEEFISRYTAKIAQLSKTTSVYFGEKSTAQDPELINYYFPNSKTIILVRDMRDIIVSFAFHFDRRYKNRLQNWTQEKSKFNEDGTIKDDFIKREVTKLKSYFHHVLNLNKGIQETVKFVKYENLISENGFDSFLEILDFIDENSTIKSTEDFLAAWENNSFEKLSKGRKPGEKDDTSFFRNGLAGDYVNHLTPEQIRFIENELKEPISKFNYL